jgi:hypothetical protein
VCRGGDSEGWWCLLWWCLLVVTVRVGVRAGVGVPVRLGRSNGRLLWVTVVLLLLLGWGGGEGVGWG